MTGNKPISDVVVAQIVALRRENLSYRQISERLKVSKSACQRAWKFFEATGQFNHNKLTGRPSAVSDRCLRHIYKICGAHSSICSREISMYCGVHLSSSSIRRIILKNLHLRGFKPPRKPLLTARMRSKRLQWCKERRNWSIDQWSKIMWSDESVIRLFSNYSSFVRCKVGCK